MSSKKTNKGRRLRSHKPGSPGLRKEASDVVAHLLDFVLKTTIVFPAPARWSDLPVPESKTQIAGECPDCGRCMAKLCASLPFKVDIGQISRSVFEDSMRKRTGCKDLKNILLLITPMRNTEDVDHNVHCYRLDSTKHLGFTTVTHKDLHMIEHCYRDGSYTILHCNRHIEPEDAARNTPIKAHIFKVVREGSKAVSNSWYKGCSVRLFFRGCKEKPKIEVPQGPRTQPSQQKPRIPLHMRGVKQENKAKVKVEQKRSPRARRDQKLNQGCKNNDHQGRKSTSPTPSRSALQAKRAELLAKVNFYKKMYNQLEERKAELRECRMALLEDDEAERMFFFFGRLQGPRSPLQDPPVLPRNLSNNAYCFLEEKLRWPSASGAFLKLRRLVKQINEQQRPRLKHLNAFFQLAQDLQFKMYVRREIQFSGRRPSQSDRYIVHCFVFDDREEFIASIALMETQLHALARVFPGARQNFRFVDSAFDLAPTVPGIVRKYLEAALEAFNGHLWFMFLGELALNRVGPKMSLFDLPPED